SGGPTGLVQDRRPSRPCRLERIPGSGIIAPRRSYGAHLHRPWCATSPERAGVSKLLPRALFGALVEGRWNVALKIHSFVEETHDFDRAVRRCRYIRKWLPRRPRRATWSVRRPDMISSRALEPTTSGPSASSPSARSSLSR